MCYAVRYKVPLNISKWAKYIDKKIIVKPFLSCVKAMEYLPNRLTLFNFKIYYKKENYLKVRTVLFKYITLFIVKFSTLICQYAQYISIQVYKYI